MSERLSPLPGRPSLPETPLSETPLLLHEMHLNETHFSHQLERPLRIQSASHSKAFCLTPSLVQDPVTFEDIAVYFSREEWQILETHERDLYREVMRENYESLLSVGYSLEKPELVLRIERNERDLWDHRLTHRRRHFAFNEQNWCSPNRNRHLIHSAKMQETKAPACAVVGGSDKRSSHLGALMRLVNEIPGFLLGNTVTDGSPSPAGTLEDQPDIQGPSVEVKIENISLIDTPTATPAPHLGNASAIHHSTASARHVKQSSLAVVTKTEEAEIAIDATATMPVPHPNVLSLGSNPDKAYGASASAMCRKVEMKIKQEKSPMRSPAHSYRGAWPESHFTKSRSSPHNTGNILHSPGARVSHTPESPITRACFEGGSGSPRMSAPLSCSSKSTSMSPLSSTDGAKTVQQGVRIKQEDCGNEERLMKPVRMKVGQAPLPPVPTLYQDLKRPGATSRRSPADRVGRGNSHLHGLVNCLKEISNSRPHPYNTFFSTAPSVAQRSAELDRICAETAIRDGALGSRMREMPPMPPNPFTVAVTNGAFRLNSGEHRVPDDWSPQLSRHEEHRGGMLYPALGRCPEKIPTHNSSPHSTGVHSSHRSNEARRPDLGLKRTHSDDHTRMGHSVKRQALESSSPSHTITSCPSGQGELRRPRGEENKRSHSNELPAGKSHLTSVMSCVRKLPSCTSSPPVNPQCGPSRINSASQERLKAESDLRSGFQDGRHKEGSARVKKEEAQSPVRPVLNVWVQPLSSPSELRSPGVPAKNVHLSGLMKLMQEIPVTESSSSSRAMFSIAVGHSETRRLEGRLDRANPLAHCSDDGIFQPEPNENTIASVDSMFSDDTSWSSENADPLYSAIGGLQKVVSDVSEVGSASPMTVASAAPVTSVTQEGNRMNKEHSVGTSSQAPPSCPYRLSSRLRSGAKTAPARDGRSCSAENAEASYAALCGLQKVVHGFSEQECVSPLSAIRTQQCSSVQQSPARRRMEQEEIRDSPHVKDSSPALRGSFLCEDGNWPSDSDSSYSAISGLQKVVNGFSEIGCISPFSAVSTTASEGATEISSKRKSDHQIPDYPAEDLPRSRASFLTQEDWAADRVDSSYSAITGLQQVVNGVPNIGSLSPLTIVSNLSSDGGQEPVAKRICERSDEDVQLVSPRPITEKPAPPAKAVTVIPDCGSHRLSKKLASHSTCIDLTKEEEQVCDKAATTVPSRQDKHRHNQAPNVPRNPSSSSQCIDLTEDEEPVTKGKDLNADAEGKKLRRSGGTWNQPSVEKWRNSSNEPARSSSRDKNKRLDPPVQERNISRPGIPAVNEHLSGLEKLLRDVPAFGSRHQSNNPNGYTQDVSWWFKSTSPHET